MTSSTNTPNEFHKWFLQSSDQSPDNNVQFNDESVVFLNRLTELCNEKSFGEPDLKWLRKNSSNFDVFCCVSCPSCQKLLEEACTLACGCTICGKCFEAQDSGEQTQTCNLCFSERRRTGTSNIKPNHVLNSLSLGKYFKKEIDSIKLQFEGLVEQEKGNFTLALEKYDQALEIWKRNHAAFLDKSKLFYKMGDTVKALEEAENSCFAKTDFEKGYIQKANILLELGRNIDALVEVLKCLVVNNFNTEAKRILNQLVLSLMNEKPNQSISTQATDQAQTASYCNETFRDKLDAIILQFMSGVQNTKCHQLAKTGPEEEVGAFTEEELRELAIDFECTLCKRIFYEPVTSTCGHVFCKECITRWLDHNPGCPICRRSLFHFINVWKLEVTTMIDDFVKIFFKDDVKERKQARVLETQHFAKVATDTTEDIPIFVCAISLPGRPMQMQIFEPRYRLMLRQCLESGSRQFGMCAYDRVHGFVDYGAMIEVKEVFVVPDGRSFIECNGGRRFKVLSRDVRDGYNTAKVEWIRDVPITPQKLDEIKEQNAKIHSDMKSFLLKACNDEDWLRNVARLPECCPEQIGTRDGPSWLWWLVDAFIESTELKLMFLSSNSLEQRLALLRRHLEMAQIN